ncbi:hypothetical protein F0P96_13140 [Hymenobacter busanensis]|uniref:Uncharacterized protein n=1 Tax=Hymenobacter busanensis TaxID=2607656 RepID=A0A7L4ZVK5_9BACT|nr:DUF6565 domain-containing protein [Hymenobacter busanensis]KAA9332412.1 hypothetical protein F0P96_13140 [Hymenobacter busanensis]QHJ07251.1 hypothetical protein GUY19_08135 [Hymenobacter busanensis]
MKRFPLLASSAAAALLLLLTTAASAQTKTTTPAKSTTPAKTSTPGKTTGPTTKTGSVISAVEEDLLEFGSWVNEQVDRADASVRRELPRLKEDYERQSSRIDRAADSLSSQSKREYEGLKDRYKTWEYDQQRRSTQASRPETLQDTQTRFLGEKANIATARASELHDLYGRFIDYTRDNRKQWTTTDWAQASALLTRLNQRYEQVRDQIEVDERVHIRSWQAEFRTFEKARATKDVLGD